MISHIKHIMIAFSVFLLIPITAFSDDMESNPDCPTLPGCPGNESRYSIPLPPIINREPLPAKNNNIIKKSAKLQEGSGRFAGMLFMPAGTFDMGSSALDGRPDERPQRQITLKEYYISKHEVSAKHYCEFLNTEGLISRDGSPRIKLDCPDCPVEIVGKEFRPKSGLKNSPVTCVSWFGASEYAEWLGARLPTSAEWENAAIAVSPPRTDTLTKNIDQLYDENAYPDSFTGNAWQWCADWYEKDYYSSAPPSNPPGPALGLEKNIRGGSRFSPQASMRPRNRHKAPPRGYFRTVGFRIVKDNG